jgi:hypothetical protein
MKIKFLFIVLFLAICSQFTKSGMANSEELVRSSTLSLPLQVPVLVLAYYPPDFSNPAYLDPVETEWINILITDMQNATQGMIDEGQTLISDASRFHGYKDPIAPQYLEYYTYDKIDYFYPIPRGYPLGGIQYRPHYNQILSNINICDYVDNHGVKEVWIYGYHTAVIIPDESKMSSKYGDVSNAYPKDEYIPEEYRLPRCANSYVMYNFTYQPGGAQAIGNTIHNRMHQIENVIFFAEDIGYPPNDNNVIGSIFWDDFSVYGNRGSLPGYQASCGNTHAPPNTAEEYDYDSTEYRENNCETWHPDDSLTTYITENCNQWGCTDIGFYKWFMQNLPGYDNGIVYNGKQMRNWWEAMYDFNQFIDAGRSLYVTSTSKVYLPLAMNNYAPIIKPIFIYPVDGQTLNYAGDWLFKVEPMANAQGFLWGFFQNGEMVWENLTDEGTLSSNEYGIFEGSVAHSKFVQGIVEVWVRASIDNEWTEAAIITIYLE